jgi:hypothetical protein
MQRLRCAIRLLPGHEAIGLRHQLAKRYCEISQELEIDELEEWAHDNAAWIEHVAARGLFVAYDAADEAELDGLE